MEDGKVGLVPVKTHIVTQRVNIVVVIEKYAGPDMGPVVVGPFCPSRFQLLQRLRQAGND